MYLAWLPSLTSLLRLASCGHPLSFPSQKGQVLSQNRPQTSGNQASLPGKVHSTPAGPAGDRDLICA